MVVRQIPSSNLSNQAGHPSVQIKAYQEPNMKSIDFAKFFIVKSSGLKICDNIFSIFSFRLIQQFEQRGLGFLPWIKRLAKVFLRLQQICLPGPLRGLVLGEYCFYLCVGRIVINGLFQSLCFLIGLAAKECTVGADLDDGICSIAVVTKRAAPRRTANKLSLGLKYFLDQWSNGIPLSLVGEAEDVMYPR